MIRCIIVEDEPKYGTRLMKLLKQMDEPIDVLSVETNISGALAAIELYTPELLFLDIQLGDETGFDLLKKVPQIDFDVIFTTAHIDRNIQEIRACALTYLPKPVIPDELALAIKKYCDKSGKGRVRTLRSNLDTERSEEKVIWINDNKSNYFPVAVKDILYCLSHNQYTDFYIKSEQKNIRTWTSTKGIGEWEDDLEQYKFCRIHNRCLVNLKHIIKYSKGDGGTVEMSNGQSLEVSKERKPKFLKQSGMK